MALALPCHDAIADDDGFKLKFGWLAFGDAYYVPSFHNEEGEDAAGLVMRRAYLTFDVEHGANWFGRLRFESNQSGEFENHDFDVTSKDLYVGRKLGEHKLILGLTSTLTFDLIEKFWGLRYLVKTPMDLQGVASRDTGVALNGPLSADGTMAYRLMYGTGEEFGADKSDSQKYMAAISWKPNAHWLMDFYADYEDLGGPTVRKTLQGFVGYENDYLRWGLQYSNQDREDNPPIELVSGFLVAKAGSQSNLVLRIDRMLEPSPKGDGIAYLPFDPSVKATMFVSGVEFHYGSHVTFTPNLVVKRYDQNDNGERPQTDVQLRLTLFFNYE